MDFVPVDQMDAAARPYFIHHRNQAEINKALMDLFRLIDFFLQSDESARDPLMSLRVVSEYMQRKGLVAPMPANLHDFYEHSPSETAQANPLFELTRLMSSINAPPSAAPTRANHIRTLSGYPTNQTPHRTRANSFSESPATTAVPLSQHSPFKQTFPEQNWREPTVDTSCVSSTREKIKAWLARPATQALRKWATRKAPSTPFSRPQFHEEDFEIIGREDYDAEEIAATRPSSPLIYGVRVETERVVKKDPLPIRHTRNKQLPQAPGGHRRSNTFSGVSSRNTTSSVHEQVDQLTKRSEVSATAHANAHRNGFPSHPHTNQQASTILPPIPLITIQPPTPPNSMQQSYEPPSPAGSTMSLDVTMPSPTPSSRSLSSSSSSSHRVRRKPVPAYVDKPSITTPSSPIRSCATSPTTPSPLRYEIQLYPSSKPTRDGLLESPHQQHMEQLTQLAEELGLGLRTDGSAFPLHQDQRRMTSTRDEDPNDLSQLRDVSRIGRAQSLSRHSQTANRHRRNVSQCSFVSSVAPSLSTVSENSHSGSESHLSDEECSEFLDCQGSQDRDEHVRRVTLPSGETLLLRGQDLEEWEMGEAIEKAEQDALRMYTQEIDLACCGGGYGVDVGGEASSVCGGILADIAARRKPSIRSHGSGSGSRSSRRSRR